MKFVTMALMVEGKAARAYLHLPETGSAPYPVVVQSYGSDFVQTQAFNFFWNELRPRNIAMVTLDLPGIGLSREIAMRPDNIPSVHKAVIQALADYPQVDASRIGVHGTSFGGHVAARVALDPPRGVMAVVVHCAPLSHAFTLPAPAYEHVSALAKDGLMDSMKIPNWNEALPLLRQQDLAKFGLGSKQIKPSLLVVTTNKDMVSPIEENTLLAEQAENGRLIVFDEPGHCLDRSVETPLSAAWLAEELGAEY